MKGREIRPVQFDEDAHAFIQQQLKNAVERWDAPLSRRLLTLSLTDSSVSFLEPHAIEAAKHQWHSGVDFETAGLGASEGDAHLSRLIGRWLKEPDPYNQRLLVLEEMMARWSDPGTGAPDVHFDDHLYMVKDATVEVNAIERDLRSLYGYPGVGILTRPAQTVVLRQELDDPDLDALASAAVALLVRAWDDEAYLIAPVESRLAMEKFVEEPIWSLRIDRADKE